MKQLLLIFFISFYSCSQDLLPIGEKAPAFSLINEKGDSISLSQFKGQKSVLLVFYPGDNTPVCKKQLCEMRDNYAYLQEEGFEVLGINDGDEKSHVKFIKKNGYQFPLLIDKNREVSELYNCKGKFGIKRTVYVVDTNGKIVFAKRGRPSSVHILESLKAVTK